MDLLEGIEGPMKYGKMSSYGTIGNPNAFMCPCHWILGHLWHSDGHSHRWP
jgi:hypothetical protein